MSHTRRSVQPSRRTALSYLLAGGALGTGLLGSAAQAQAFPGRPVKVVLMYPPGGGADHQARLIGEQFRVATGQPMVGATPVMPEAPNFATGGRKVRSRARTNENAPSLQEHR